MAYAKFPLPLISWRKWNIDALILWKTKHHTKGLRLLKCLELCTLKMHGGLNMQRKAEDKDENNPGPLCFPLCVLAFSLMLNFVKDAAEG